MAMSLVCNIRQAARNFLTSRTKVRCATICLFALTWYMDRNDMRMVESLKCPTCKANEEFHESQRKRTEERE